MQSKRGEGEGLAACLDEDTGVPGGVPGEGDHAQITRFLLYVRNPVAAHRTGIMLNSVPTVPECLSLRPNWLPPPPLPK